ncbi:putative kinase [Corynascus novoguineensis]|uniref:Kinase n=1 Tax=Corynascus novoguineensis TaxID=1126955 RepID=A0AAN7CKJ5_9PEZI|nr:putative kinase [Corynascus novoguineensis]
MSSSNYKDSEGESPLSLNKPSVPAEDADDSDKPQLSSPDQPAEPAEGTDYADHSDSDKPKPTTRGVKEIIREKLRALGRPVPPSPPPPPNPSSNALSQELLDLGGQVIYKKFSCWIVKHACGTRLTKFCQDGIRPSEAEAMRFVSEHTSIPVPRVYDVGEEHITMEFIEGETLAKAWEDILSVEDRTLVIRQLRDYINQLRAIKSPDGMICSFGGRPAVDCRLFYHEGGPFENEATYNEFLLSDLHSHAIVHDMIRTQMRTDHEIVLTHGDLHAINIMVRPGVGVVAILDWELAGFYPEYTELVKPFRPANWGCGYYRELHNIFPQRYDAEFLVDQMLSVYTRH